MSRDLSPTLRIDLLSIASEAEAASIRAAEADGIAVLDNSDAATIGWESELLALNTSLNWDILLVEPIEADQLASELARKSVMQTVLSHVVDLGADQAW